MKAKKKERKIHYLCYLHINYPKMFHIFNLLYSLAPLYYRFVFFGCCVLLVLPTSSLSSETTIHPVSAVTLSREHCATGCQLMFVQRAAGCGEQTNEQNSTGDLSYLSQLGCDPPTAILEATNKRPKKIKLNFANTLAQHRLLLRAA